MSPPFDFKLRLEARAVSSDSSVADTSATGSERNGTCTGQRAVAALAIISNR